MTYSIMYTTSKRIKKVKIFSEHLDSHPVYLESVFNLEKNSVYKPLTPEVKEVVIDAINENNLHKYNDDILLDLKDNIANYFAISSVKPDNVFISQNIYNFYECLTEVFLQKDQKVLLYTSKEYSYAQEAKYINCGRIIIDNLECPVKSLDEIISEVNKDDYKIVILCLKEFDIDQIRNIADLLPENIVLVLRTPNHCAFEFSQYGNKTIIILREFPFIMTLVEAPMCFAISRNEVIGFMEKLQLSNPIDSLSLHIAKYFTQLENPVEYKFKPTLRNSESYNEILMSLVRENIESVKCKESNYGFINTYQKIKSANKDIIDFSSGNHFLGLSEEMKKTLRELVNSEKRYNYAEQKSSLRNLIATSLSDSNYKIHYSNILIGAGVTKLLEYIGRAFINDGEGYKKLYKEKVLMFDLSPDNYSRAVEKQDAIVEFAAIDPFLNAHVDDLISKISYQRPKLIIIDNPRILSGTYFDANQIETLIKSTPEETILVVDESLYQFAKYENPDFISAVDYVKDHPNLIVLRSFSTIAASAGQRLGYMVANENIINAIDCIRSPFDVSPFSIQLGLNILLGNEIFEMVTLKFVQEQKELLYKKLTDMGIFYVKSSTNSVVLSTQYDSYSMIDKLLDYGMRVKPLIKNFIRVSINEQKHNINFLKSLEEII